MYILVFHLFISLPLSVLKLGYIIYAFFSTPAGRRYQTLQRQNEQLHEELYKTESGEDIVFKYQMFLLIFIGLLILILLIVNLFVYSTVLLRLKYLSDPKE